MADGDIHWYRTDRELGNTLVYALQLGWHLVYCSYVDADAEGREFNGWHLVFRKASEEGT